MQRVPPVYPLQHFPPPLIEHSSVLEPLPVEQSRTRWGENIDLEPRLHAMMCPDMAAPPAHRCGSGAAPGVADAFAVSTRQRRKQINKESDCVYRPLPGPSSCSAAHSCSERRERGESSGLLACNSILQHIRAGTCSFPGQNLHSSPTAGEWEIDLTQKHLFFVYIRSRGLIKTTTMMFFVCFFPTPQPKPRAA